MATLAQQIEALLAQYSASIQKAFADALGDIADQTILSDVIKAIENGDPAAALRAIGLTDAALRPVIAQLEQAFETGGVTVGSTFPKRLNTPTGRVVFRFDIRDSAAEKWLREESSQLVTAIQEDARINVQNVMQKGVLDGRNPRSIGLDITGRIDPVSKRRVGGVIGLNQQQSAALIRARDELATGDANYFNRELRDKRFDSIVQKAMDSGKKLSDADITRIAGKYNDNLLRHRGEVVGRTEALAALNKSEYLAVKQAQATGAINESATKRVWDSAGHDGRTRATHLQMEGQSVGLDEPFTTPGGYKLMHPGDGSLGAPGKETIQCRCRVRLKIDWLADLD